MRVRRIRTLGLKIRTHSRYSRGIRNLCNPRRSRALIKPTADCRVDENVREEETFLLSIGFASALMIHKPGIELCAGIAYGAGKVIRRSKATVLDDLHSNQKRI